MTLSPMLLIAVSEALTGLLDLEGKPIEGEVSGVAAEQITRRCQECGKPFVPCQPHREGKGKYCSWACNGRARGKRGTGEAKSRSTQLRAYHAERKVSRETTASRARNPGAVVD